MAGMTFWQKRDLLPEDPTGETHVPEGDLTGITHEEWCSRVFFMFKDSDDCVEFMTLVAAIAKPYSS